MTGSVIHLCSIHNFYVPLIMCHLYYVYFLLWPVRLYIVSLSSLHGSPSHWRCFLIGLLLAAILILISVQAWLGCHNMCVFFIISGTLYDHVPLFMCLYIACTYYYDRFGLTLCPIHLCMDSLYVGIALHWSAPCSHHFLSPIPAGMTWMSRCYVYSSLFVFTLYLFFFIF